MKILMSIVLTLYVGGLSCTESFQDLANIKSYPYPYHGLEAELREQGKTTIPIFSFGSLLDTQSARKTFSDKTLKTSTVSVAYGTKRVFNRDIPIDPGHDWGVPCHPLSRAMLNLVTTDNENDVTNGVLVNVHVNDIAPMRRREYGYNLIPILISTWDDYKNGSDREYMIAYAFHSPENTVFTNDQILPRPGYYEMARDAAIERGPEFYRMWLESTYRADGVTPIYIWEQHVQKEDRRTLIHYREKVAP